MKPSALIATLLVTPLLALGGNPPFQPNELTIEGMVDGPSTFHLRAEGIYWVNGANAKPGKHEGRNEPTYVNGQPWQPRWRKSKEERGPDRTELYRIDFGTVDVDFKLLAVTRHRGESGIDRRTEVATKREGNEFIVTIPDPEISHRWYKFTLRKKAK
jgi:hypothetical protein